MKNLRNFNDFKMSEGQQVQTIDMMDKASSHVEEAIQGLKIASSELYELKKMADEIKLDWPDLSKDIIDIVEPLMTDIENKEKEINNILKIIK